MPSPHTHTHIHTHRTFFCIRYLPASLCPVIQEGSERFVIRPDVNEVMKRLPELSSTTPHHQARRSICDEAEGRGVIDLSMTGERPFGKRVPVIGGGNQSEK